MRSQQVVNGDIVLDSGGRLQFVQGSSKLTQDIDLWLAEEYGVGFTTPNFGSILYSFAGQANTTSLQSQVQSEVQRIISLYQQQQTQNLLTAQTQAQLSYYNKSEIIASVNSIQVYPLPNSTIMGVTVDITTLAGSSVNVSFSINPNGVQVTNG